MKDYFKNIKGAGDLVALLLGFIGVKPWKNCGCEKRQEQLNKLLKNPYYQAPKEFRIEESESINEEGEFNEESSFWVVVCYVGPEKNLYWDNVARSIVQISPNKLTEDFFFIRFEDTEWVVEMLNDASTKDNVWESSFVTVGIDVKKVY